MNTKSWMGGGGCLLQISLSLSLCLKLIKTFFGESSSKKYGRQHFFNNLRLRNNICMHAMRVHFPNCSYTCIITDSYYRRLTNGNGGGDYSSNSELILY